PLSGPAAAPVARSPRSAPRLPPIDPSVVPEELRSSPRQPPIDPSVPGPPSPNVLGATAVNQPPVIAPATAQAGPMADPRLAAPVQRPPDTAQIGWRTKRDLRSRGRVKAREARWQNNRLAVPYPTDGPKITLGIAWFSLLVGAVLLGSYFDAREIAAVAVAAVGAPVAGLAGLQTGNAWFPALPATRGWTAVAAYLTAIAGFAGGIGVLVGLSLGLVTLGFYVVLYRGHRRQAHELYDVLVRSAIPAGLAVACLAALGTVGIGVLLSLILLVSAYEAGDFVVGSGAANAIEGPLAGLVSLGAVTFLLFLVQPAPFDTTSVLLFSVLAGLCCPLGQYLASGLLPRGNAWAPALRRLDSYLLAAPLWLLLAGQLPAAG
ncbi:MAG: hypothetical protein AAF547_09510, partial [Actinomycetota bacterium]